MRCWPPAVSPALRARLLFLPRFFTSLSFILLPCEQRKELQRKKRKNRQFLVPTIKSLGLALFEPF